MQRLLLIFLLLATMAAGAQRGYLFVKKGHKKVKTFAEGSPITFATKNGLVIKGAIAMVQNDSILINGHWYPASGISRIILRGKEGSLLQPLLLTTAFVGLSTAGMTLAKWATFRRSLIYSSVIGFGNFLIRQVPRIKRKQYRVGRKFSVQTLDLRF